MSRRKLGLRTDDLKELRVKPVPTWCTKSKQTTIFKKKKKNKEDDGCFVCESPDHWIKKCPNCTGRKPQPE
jgi:hypothetical protein